MVSELAKIRKAIKAKDFDALEVVMRGMEDAGAVKWKVLDEVFPELEACSVNEEGEAVTDYDEPVLNALEGLMYFWCKNMTDAGVPTFLKYADHCIELTDEDFEKAGKFYENLHIFVCEESGCVIPETVDPTEYYLLAAENYMRDGSLRAEGVLTKIKNRIKRSNAEKWVRFKSLQSRIQDSHRRYGGASYAYLSTLKDAEALGMELGAEDIMATLQNAAVCAMLDKHGPPRTAVLQEIVSHPHFDNIALAGVTTKFANNQLLSPQDKKTLIQIADDHHNALMASGHTIIDDAFIRQNISVVSSIYKRVNLQTLTEILGMTRTTQAETIVSDMINKEGLKAIIDGVAGTVEFNPDDSKLISWEDHIAEFCNELETLCHDIEATKSG